MHIYQLQAQNSSWIELNRSAFKNNVGIYKNLIGDKVLLGSVFKGHAFGHGFAEMVKLVYENPIDIIFTINPYDAFYIRKYAKTSNQNKKCIVVIGAIVPKEVLECAKQGIEVSLNDEHFRNHDYFSILKSYKNNHSDYKPLKVHIHIDTIGHNGTETITAEMIAEWSGTIQYEILTRLSQHLRRFFDTPNWEP